MASAISAWLAVGVVLLFSTGAYAQDSCPAYAAAYASCMTQVQNYEATGGGTAHCEARQTGPVPGGTQYQMWFVYQRNDGVSGEQSRGLFTCNSGTALNHCSEAPDMSGAFAGNLSAGATMCSPQGDGTACTMSFTPDSPPYLNRAGTQWGTHGTYKATGALCTSQGSNAPPPPVPPKSCGGVSCYDSGGDKYCMVNSSGAQVCVKGSDGRKPGGACASGGDATLCAGSPQPPKPPAPPQSPISDPPTETKGGDRFTNGSNGAGGTSAGGGNITITTGAYGAGGSPTGSGQVSGDDGPAGASTSGLPGGTGDGEGDKDDGSGASGGGDCSNAPVVSGSPALAMVARQAWETRCAAEKVHKDLAGDGTASPGDITAPSGKSIWVDTPASGDASADAANKGNYDMSGMGLSTVCPMHDLDVPLWDGRSFSIGFSKGCDVGVWIRVLVIAFALFAAAKITVGGNN